MTLAAFYAGFAWSDTNLGPGAVFGDVLSMWLLWNWPLLNVVGENGSGWPRNFINSGPFITFKSTLLILLYRWWLPAYCPFAISIVAKFAG